MAREHAIGPLQYYDLADAALRFLRDCVCVSVAGFAMQAVPVFSVHACVRAATSGCTRAAYNNGD